MNLKLLLLGVVALVAAKLTFASEQAALQTNALRSIVVVPVANKSLDVDAPYFTLATLPIPLAEKGYYVFPVNTTKVVLEQEGWYEGDRIHQEPADVIAKLFDADAVFYVTINRWDAQYALITTTVTVEFSYKLVGRDGTEIWKETKRASYSPQTNNSGHPLATLIAAAINAAVARAAPNYLPLTKQAHSQAISYGSNAIPDGPYRVEFNSKK